MLNILILMRTAFAVGLSLFICRAAITDFNRTLPLGGSELVELAILVIAAFIIYELGVMCRALLKKRRR
jgi:hypothetical protein